ncbi:MFS transporter [Roseomonas sp. AR75]|uniref:MFS transporter n=1 Tax=Roseomonas sp. AR75 TaxID=2562311 RepID=UPI0010C08DCA|nr:MFS transporter [Roseomonas sp. AR75]
MRLGEGRNLLLVALGAMFVQQSFATLGRNLPPVIAPAILADQQLDPALLGIYVGMVAMAALVTQLSCGSFIIRHGALRMSQVSLLLLALALAVATVPPVAFFAISALLCGAGSALSTPASSHLLGRYATAKQAPLVFSIKQTAVPAGLLLSGLVGPLLTGWWGWRAAMLFGAAGCLAFAAMLQPLRRGFDDDRVPTQLFRLSDMHRTLGVVMRGRDLRNLALACGAFSGLQSAFIAFFVTFLVAQGQELAAAGAFFSGATLVAVPGRILWGWVAGAHVAPGRLMGLLAIGMGLSGILLGLAGALDSVLMIGAAALGMSITALSWHGVLLAEAARLAPAGMRGAATGGVLSFGQVGGLVAPLVFALMLSLTGSYGAGFVVSALPALLLGLFMLRGRD